MKILFLTSRVPYPPHRGDKLRTYNFLHTLARDHEVALISFAESGEEGKRELQSLCREVHFVELPTWRSWAQVAACYPSRLPSQIAYYLSGRMAAVVRGVGARFRPDVSYVHLLRMFPYRRFLPPSTYVVLDLVDVISKELFRSLPYRPAHEIALVHREALRSRAYERFATRLANETWVISSGDRADILAAGGGGEVHVVSNGTPDMGKGSDRSPDPGMLLFYGYAPVAHNQDALRFLLMDVIPRMSQERGLRLVVVGAGKQRHRGHVVGEGGFPIEYRGFLDRPTEAFSHATLVVAPIRFSAGVQNKIVEAMAAGVPVCTTPFGNEGIEGVDGVHLAVCSTAEAFAQRIQVLLQHSEEREMMAQRGQAFVLQKFSWNDVRRRMRGIEQKTRRTHLNAL